MFEFDEVVVVKEVCLIKGKPAVKFHIANPFTGEYYGYALLTPEGRIRSFLKEEKLLELVKEEIESLREVEV